MQKSPLAYCIFFAALLACSGKPLEFHGKAPILSENEQVGSPIAQQKAQEPQGSDSVEEAIENKADSAAIESFILAASTTSILESADSITPAPAGTVVSTNSSGSQAPTGMTTPQVQTLVITVPATTVRTGSGAIVAVAMLSGQTNAAAVTWKVTASNNQNAGTVLADGLYTPPANGGPYDVILSAALIDDAAITASVTLKLVPEDQIFVSCQQGSLAFPIKADVYQLPTNTSKLPDFNAIGPKLTTVCMDQYAVAARDWSTGFPGLPGLFEWFALRTTTQLIIPAQGSYSFQLNSDDGAKLSIDGILVIDNDGQHAPTAKTADINLAAGEHTLSIDYFQGPRYQIALELFWKLPGSASYAYVPKTSFK